MSHRGYVELQNGSYSARARRECPECGELYETQMMHPVWGLAETQDEALVLDASE